MRRAYPSSERLRRPPSPTRGDRRLGGALTALLLIFASPALAEPAATLDRPLASPAQEARAQALFEEVRCVVCQHESIADSPAGLAADMRRLVREEIASGSSDDAVRADLVRRWGDFILFKPPVNLATWLLWFGPALAVLLIGALFGWRALSRRAETSTPLSPEEEAELAELLAHREVRPDTDANPPHDGRQTGSSLASAPD